MQCLLKLKSLDLSYSKHLKILPDFAMTTSLEKINLNGCESLIEIPSSIQCLKGLNSLDLSRCKKLRSLPQIPRGINNLCLDNSGVEEWSPSSEQFLDNLQVLNIANCKNLRSLPRIIHCNAFRTVDISSCPNLIMFPHIIENSEVLPSSNGCHVDLDLSECKMVNSLPNSICELKSLESLNLYGCSNLRKLSPLYGLCSLKWLYLDGTALVEIPPDIVSLSSLEALLLNDTPIEELPSSIGFRSSLTVLNLGGCERLKSLPNSIFELKCLSSLDLSGCSNLEKLPPLYGLCSLQKLFLNGTALVEIPPDTAFLSSLRRLSLKNCNRLQTAVSTSYIAPIKYREECKIYRYELNFCNCVNLDQNAHGTIMADALRRTKELAIATSLQFQERGRAYGHYFFVSLPGSKIPEWLNCEGPGNSTATLFPPGCFNNMFLGFAFCVILEFKAPVHVHFLDFTCQSNFKSNNGYTEANFRFVNWFSETTFESDHVFFWYDGEDTSSLDWLKQNCYIEIEASFKFKATDEKVKVKRCGFHLLYTNDELNNCNPYICGETNPDFLEQFKETTNANNKRSREDFYSSNINGNQEVETHTKRLRQKPSMEDYFSNAQDGINYDATMVPSSSSCEFVSKFYKFL
ncbi:disease resistance protein RPP5-like [Hevea brasiliensis]|uniref:disease resistance protein RPP5-like n=1 Tax=Hevea brasiliensis TaxID=3981 RepID=UPI0025F01955|nr:disease resistance protein RPP5-like [Hevea brasiliensis]XP_057987424.1 disease resistance protein RPP5-like [Hevea brasiliensis]XP_057987425.1 disease resistance protein RPP5-like [Hevea brasiliensis]XP_057987426.1 disease resistance protein RPP5-like [Hevea brasiliensis]